MRNFIYSIFLLFFISCNNTITPTETQKKDTIFLDGKKINHKHSLDSLYLESFLAIPDTIDGCSEIFYEGDEKTNFIFITNLQTFGIIKIKGNDYYLMKDITQNNSTKENAIIEEYSNEVFKIRLNLQKVNQLDYLEFYEGKFLFYNNDSLIIEKKVKAEVGC